MIATTCAWIIGLCMILCSIRLFRGPKFADRVVAIDLVGILSLALIVFYVHISDETVYLDVAVVLAVVAFLGTVVFARFLETAPTEKSTKRKERES